MALRASYYGIKRQLKQKLTDIAGSWDATVATIFPRSEQNVLGAKNLLSPYYTGSKVRTFATALIVTSNDDGSVLFNGTPDAGGSADLKRRVPNNNRTDFYLPIGKYRCVIDDGLVGAVGITVNVTASGSSVRIGQSGDKRYADFEIKSDTACDYKLTDGSCLVSINMTFIKDHVYNNVLIHPMVILQSDDNFTYEHYSMTNQELTASADDQKTAINAIITAATDAADFAAFKTAMEAITPVSRSFSVEGTTEPDSRSIPEEDPEPTTKKRTTKKTIVKEGE